MAIPAAFKLKIYPTISTSGLQIMKELWTLTMRNPFVLFAITIMSIFFFIQNLSITLILVKWPRFNIDWLIKRTLFFFTPVNHNFVCLSKQANWKRDLKIHKALANFSTHFVGNEQDDNRKQERSISWGENERNFSENGQEPGWEPIDVWIHQRSTNWCLYHASPHICLQYRLNQCSIEISTINISVVKNIQLSFISQIKCCMFI